MDAFPAFQGDEGGPLLPIHKQFVVVASIGFGQPGTQVQRQQAEHSQTDESWPSPANQHRIDPREKKRAEWAECQTERVGSVFNVGWIDFDGVANHHIADESDRKTDYLIHNNSTIIEMRYRNLEVQRYPEGMH